MPRSFTDHIVIHYSAATQVDGRDVTARDIDRWHRAKGWLGIGYNFVIERGGSIVPGRAVDAVGAHTLNYNHRSVGICVVGQPDDTNPTGVNFTDAQWRALGCQVGELAEKYPNARVCGHRDLNATQCPGFDVGAWWTGLTAHNAL